MPFIDQKDLIKLYDEIDILSEKEKELRKGYIDLKLESTKISESQRKKKIIIILLFSLVCLLGFFLLRANKTNKDKLLQSKLDSVARLHTLQYQKKNEIVQEKKLIYSVQIGVFKNLDIDHSIHKGFTQIEGEEGVYTYMIGEFLTYKQVRVFKNQIVNLGVKDAFIVAYYNSKRISINKALKISNELDFYDE